MARKSLETIEVWIDLDGTLAGCQSWSAGWLLATVALYRRSTWNLPLIRKLQEMRGWGILTGRARYDRPFVWLFLRMAGLAPDAVVTSPRFRQFQRSQEVFDWKGGWLLGSSRQVLYVDDDARAMAWIPRVEGIRVATSQWFVRD